MITFKNFLVERTTGKRDVAVSEKKAIELVRSHCMNAIKSKTAIYRGIGDDTKNWLAIDPKSFERTSANTNNFYNVLVSEILPEWKNYPQRNRSMICTTDVLYAKNYGEVYVVLPEDGATIGVCPNGDFWESFKEIGKIFKRENTKNTFSNSVYEFVDPMDPADVNKFFDNIQYEPTFKRLIGKQNLSNNLATSILSWIEKITEVVPTINLDVLHYSNDKKLKSLFYLMKHNGNDMLAILSNMFDPKTNGFNIAKAGDSIPKNREVWTSNKSVLVKLSEFNRFRDQVLGK